MSEETKPPYKTSQPQLREEPGVSHQFLMSWATCDLHFDLHSGLFSQNQFMSFIVKDGIHMLLFFLGLCHCSL